ncbi:Uncharacterised protein [Mycobacterium tuberculosis]|nr:Uncharacterised protein [Mycobacterium tuberculosis]
MPCPISSTKRPRTMAFFIMNGELALLLVASSSDSQRYSGE